MKNLTKRIKILLLAFLIVGLPASAQENQPQPEIQILQKNEKSPIEIISSSNLIVNGNQKISRESAVKVSTLRGGHGSGTFTKIGKHYVVITAGHVARDNFIFSVQGEKGETVIGELIYISSRVDLAVIKVPNLISRKPAKLKQTNSLEDLKIGAPVVYTGYPSSYELLTSVAMVSGYEPEYNSVILQGFAWPGSSGSGVFDRDGKMRGVVVAIGAEELSGIGRQLLETLVYIHPLHEEDIKNIKKILKGG